ncbi:hypothetical protein HXX76_013156 [Chlamydomonas incerta]|uniref:Guanylate cyclase domain-containing protein n=1 Tax=Chlamydomonas incerta TaxID=51695 RepID=A0A835VSI1_CHLIN|nr:hypothetical protein HXX76_013156 [Chlamydomonas incerta]|eukprot:KAG2426175.1 hypothetical protein HXX76_013156 [Chlamydomonas incerta]
MGPTRFTAGITVSPPPPQITTGPVYCTTAGDSFILAFCTPTSALCFAADVQLALLAVEWPAPLLEHPDACELMVAVDPAGVGGGGGGGTAASAAAAQQTAAAAAAAHVNSQYGPVSPNGGAGGLAGGSSSSRGLAGMMGTATPSPSGTNQLRAAAGMDSHRLSGHHHSPTSSPLPYQRSFWSNAGQGSLLGPQPVALQGPSSGVGAAGGFAVVGVGAAGFGGGAGGASAAGALHNSRMSGRLRMSAGVGHGSGPGSGLGNGGTAAYGQPFPGSYGPSSNHGPGSYGGGGGGGPNSGPGSRAHSQYGRASNGEGVAPLYGLQNLAGAVAADANNDGAGPASGGGARMRPARAAADDATALAAMYGSGGSGGTGGGGYTGCEGASGRGGAPSHREVAGPVTESTEDDPSGRVQEPQATVISSIAAAAAAGTFPGKDKDASTRTAGVPLGPPSSAGASEYGPPTRQVIDALMRGRFNNLYEPTGSALTVGLSREQTQVAQEVGDYDMATNWRESLAALFPALLAGGLGAFASAADGGGGASMYMRPSVQVSHKRLSVLGLPPMGAGGGKPQTQVCWRGLRVRMGLHSGLDGEEHIIFNKVSMTYKYYGPFADAANATNETVPGGLIALSAAIFDRLKNAHGGGSSSSRIVKSAPDTLAAGVLIIYAGHHQLKDTPPPAPAPAAPKAAPAPLPPQLLLTSPFKSGSARKLLTAATGGAAGGDAAAAAGGGGGLASREPSTVHVSLSTATSPQPRSSSVTAIGAGAAGPAPPSARSSAAKSTATAAAASAAAAMALVMSTAADGTPLYVAVPRALMCRLAHAPPLRTCKVLQQGNWAAPVGLVCIGFMKVVGVTSLLTELPAPAARALSAFQSLVCSRLGAAGGYLLEGGDGLALVAFGNAGCAVGWALDCVEALKEMDWEDELLSHELCEEVYTYFDKPRAGGGGAFAGGVDSQDVGPSATVALSSTAVEVSLNAAATITAAAAVVGEARTASTMRRVHADALRANRKLLYRGLRVKVGMDIGHAVHALGATSARIEYRGKVMNRAARIAGFASTGQVCVSAGLWQAAEASGALLDLERPVVGLSMGLVPLK